MERVTEDNIDDMLNRYIAARGGLFNEDTNSEAMFVCVGKYRGAYILSTWQGPVWVGVQNATARWTRNGCPFKSMLDALNEVIHPKNHPLNRDLAVYYFEDSVLMLRWLADYLRDCKSAGDFLLYEPDVFCGN
jgi:hypothetical protein